MKTSTSISKTLGLTQKEMAQLLDVSRSLLSLYELGKRDLPLKAKQRLEQLLEQTQIQKAGAKDGHTLLTQDFQTHLHSLLQENTFQTQLIQRKIATLKRKQDTAANLNHLMQVLAEKPNDGTPRFALSDKDKAKSKTNHAPDLAKLELKCELLAVERAFLEKRLAQQPK